MAEHPKPPIPHLQILSAAVLACAALLAYSNSFSAPFHLDDIGNVLNNPAIQQLDSIKRAIMGCPGFGSAGRPLLNLSLAVNWAISGKNPYSYHIFNILVHIFAGFALLGLMRKILLSPKLFAVFGRHAEFASFSIALIWIVHPLNTVGVTYVSQRAETMMGLFFLLTMYFAIRGFYSGSSRLFHAAAVVSFFFGAASKEVIIVAPLIVLACDVILFEKTVKRALGESLFLYLGLGAGIIALVAWTALGGSASANPIDFKISRLNYALIQARVIATRYLPLSVWPSGLCFSYEGMPMRVRPSDWLCGLFLVAALTATAWALWRRKPAGLAGAFFFLVLAPTSSFMPITIPAGEHRLYLPLAALVALCVLSAAKLLEWVAERRGASPKARKATLAAAALCVAILASVLAVATFARNKIYRDELTLWNDTKKKMPESGEVTAWLAWSYLNAGSKTNALNLYSEALQLKPSYAMAHYNLAIILIESGYHGEARRHFLEAVRYKPEMGECYLNLGVLSYWEGKKGEAAAYFRKALATKPGIVSAHINLAQYHMDRREWRQAADECRAALAIAPNDPNAASCLALCVKKQKGQ